MLIKLFQDMKDTVHTGTVIPVKSSPWYSGKLKLCTSSVKQIHANKTFYSFKVMGFSVTTTPRLGSLPEDLHQSAI